MFWVDLLPVGRDDRRGSTTWTETRLRWSPDSSKETPLKPGRLRATDGPCHRLATGQLVSSTKRPTFEAENPCQDRGFVGTPGGI